MKILAGSSALSAFRISKILSVCHEKSIPVINLEAQFVHFIDSISEFTVEQQLTLDKLLQYGPKSVHIDKDCNTNKQLFLVTPRAGTISPWSSKATDIAHNCGLTQIHRIERGIAYYVVTSSPLTQPQQDKFAELIHDRMMETVLTSFDQAEQLFKVDEPAPVTVVDL